MKFLFLILPITILLLILYIILKPKSEENFEEVYYQDYEDNLIENNLIKENNDG